MKSLANVISELEHETGPIPAEKKEFALNLVNHNGNKSAAAREMGIPARSAGQRGYEMANDPEIQRLVNEINKYKSVEITEDFIKGGLMKEALEADNSRDRREALHLLGKTKTMFKDGVENTVKQDDNEFIAQVEKMFGKDAANKAKEDLGLDSE